MIPQVMIQSDRKLGHVSKSTVACPFDSQYIPTRQQCSEDSMLLHPRPVQRVIRIVAGLWHKDSGAVFGVLEIA